MAELDELRYRGARLKCNKQMLARGTIIKKLADQIFDSIVGRASNLDRINDFLTFGFFDS
jgi:hypothetical protein